MPAPAGFLPGSRGELENNLLPEARHIAVHDLIQMCDRIGMRKKTCQEKNRDDEKDACGSRKDVLKYHLLAEVMALHDQAGGLEPVP